MARMSWPFSLILKPMTLAGLLVDPLSSLRSVRIGGYDWSGLSRTFILEWRHEPLRYRATVSPSPTIKTSDPYVFDQTTNKIDMKEQRREMRLRFESDEAGGDYQMGKVILNATFGDVRGY
jgi:hypothetical protein